MENETNSSPLPVVGSQHHSQESLVDVTGLGSEEPTQLQGGHEEWKFSSQGEVLNDYDTLKKNEKDGQTEKEGTTTEVSEEPKSPASPREEYLSSIPVGLEYEIPSDSEIPSEAADLASWQRKHRKKYQKYTLKDHSQFAVRYGKNFSAAENKITVNCQRNMTRELQSLIQDWDQVENENSYVNKSSIESSSNRKYPSPKKGSDVLSEDDIISAASLILNKCKTVQQSSSLSKSCLKQADNLILTKTTPGAYQSQTHESSAPNEERDLFSQEDMETYCGGANVVNDDSECGEVIKNEGDNAILRNISDAPKSLHSAIKESPVKPFTEDPSEISSCDLTSAAGLIASASGHSCPQPLLSGTLKDDGRKQATSTLCSKSPQQKWLLKQILPSKNLAVYTSTRDTRSNLRFMKEAHSGIEVVVESDDSLSSSMHVSEKDGQNGNENRKNDNFSKKILMGTDKEVAKDSPFNTDVSKQRKHSRLRLKLKSLDGDTAQGREGDIQNLPLSFSGAQDVTTSGPAACVSVKNSIDILQKVNVVDESVDENRNAGGKNVESRYEATKTKDCVVVLERLIGFELGVRYKLEGVKLCPGNTLQKNFFQCLNNNSSSVCRKEIENSKILQDDDVVQEESLDELRRRILEEELQARRIKANQQYKASLKPSALRHTSEKCTAHEGKGVSDMSILSFDEIREQILRAELLERKAKHKNSIINKKGITDVCQRNIGQHSTDDTDLRKISEKEAVFDSEPIPDHTVGSNKKIVKSKTEKCKSKGMLTEVHHEKAFTDEIIVIDGSEEDVDKYEEEPHNHRKILLKVEDVVRNTKEVAGQKESANNEVAKVQGKGRKVKKKNKREATEIAETVQSDLSSSECVPCKKKQKKLKRRDNKNLTEEPTEDYFQENSTNKKKKKCKCDKESIEIEETLPENILKNVPSKLKRIKQKKDENVTEDSAKNDVHEEVAKRKTKMKKSKYQEEVVNSVGTVQETKLEDDSSKKRLKQVKSRDCDNVTNETAQDDVQEVSARKKKKKKKSKYLEEAVEIEDIILHNEADNVPSQKKQKSQEHVDTENVTEELTVADVEEKSARKKKKKVKYQDEHIDVEETVVENIQENVSCKKKHGKLKSRDDKNLTDGVAQEDAEEESAIKKKKKKKSKSHEEAVENTVEIVSENAPDSFPSMKKQKNLKYLDPKDLTDEPAVADAEESGESSARKKSKKVKYQDKPIEIEGTILENVLEDVPSKKKRKKLKSRDSANVIKETAQDDVQEESARKKKKKVKYQDEHIDIEETVVENIQEDVSCKKKHGQLKSRDDKNVTDGVAQEDVEEESIIKKKKKKKKSKSHEEAVENTVEIVSENAPDSFPCMKNQKNLKYLDTDDVTDEPPVADVEESGESSARKKSKKVKYQDKPIEIEGTILENVLEDVPSKKKRKKLKSRDSANVIKETAQDDVQEESARKEKKKNKSKFREGAMEGEIVLDNKPDGFACGKKQKNRDRENLPEYAIEDGLQEERARKRKRKKNEIVENYVTAQNIPIEHIFRKKKRTEKNDDVYSLTEVASQECRVEDTTEPYWKTAIETNHPVEPVVIEIHQNRACFIVDDRQNDLPDKSNIYSAIQNSCAELLHNVSHLHVPKKRRKVTTSLDESPEREQVLSPIQGSLDETDSSSLWFRLSRDSNGSFTQTNENVDTVSPQVTGQSQLNDESRYIEVQDNNRVSEMNPSVAGSHREIPSDEDFHLSYSPDDFQDESVSYNDPVQQLSAPQEPNSENMVATRLGPRYTVHQSGTSAFAENTLNYIKDRKSSTNHNTCTRCQNKFKTPIEMMRHECTAKDPKDKKRPNDERAKFKCRLCDRVYIKKCHMNHHIRATHQKIRKHICSECPMAFSEAQTLTVHLRYHFGNKPYECNLCKLSYVNSSHLFRHYSEVHKLVPNFPCDYCKNSYFFEPDLKLHIKRCHKKKAIGIVETIA
ncbi:hypothetical protein ONE63_000519 [Megalurothrips usitatus]|uniref:C2H2-type domain-containing protein n=1 Tax=Megalurothrips usitatus TaxID=439358 RepID=A0AAV7Y4R9_9NEOP|nr:hypothetical protein ONE63_000519 [Megalurothrips usitatus]